MIIHDILHVRDAEDQLVYEVWEINVDARGHRAKHAYIGESRDYETALDYRARAERGEQLEEPA